LWQYICAFRSCWNILAWSKWDSYVISQVTNSNAMNEFFHMHIFICTACSGKSIMLSIINLYHSNFEVWKPIKYLSSAHCLLLQNQVSTYHGFL
jgi:hypothetical protein